MGEIHLVGRGALNLFHEAFQRQQHIAVGVGGELPQGQQVLHEHDVLGHGLGHAGSAHLHGHRSAVEEGGPVHLGDGGGP